MLRPTRRCILHQSASFLTLLLLMTSIDACNFGSGAGCLFPCRCAAPDEVCDQTSGHCISGCRKTLPNLYNVEVGWTGPGCLLGNVAYGKTASQISTYDNSATYTADRAVDGYVGPYLQGGHCAHPGSYNGPPVWWMVDLGGLHRVTSITVFNSDDSGGYWRLQRFSLYVSNSPDTTGHGLHDRCNWRYYSIGSGAHETLTCRSSTPAGRYVLLIREEGSQIYFMNLCEVVVLGNAYMACTDSCDGLCTTQYGCITCPPGKDPRKLCQDCEDGSFGPNCAGRCGNCLYGNLNCSKEEGTCPGGCRLWSATPHCNVSIDRLDFKADSYIVVDNATDASATVRWSALDGVPESAAEHYFYAVQYKLASTDQPWRYFTRVPHTAGMPTYEVEVQSLAYNADYMFKVVPYRTHMGTNSSGDATESVTVKTKCTMPGQATILNATSFYERNRTVEAVEIIWKHPETSGCDGFNRTMVGYRKESGELWEEEMTTNCCRHTFRPTSAGDIRVVVTVFNTADLHSTADETVMVEARILTAPAVDMIIGISVAALCLLAAAALVTFFILRKRRSERRKNKQQTPAIIPAVAVNKGLVNVIEMDEVDHEKQETRSEDYLTDDSMDLEEVLYENTVHVPEKIPLVRLETCFMDKCRTDTLQSDFKALPFGQHSQCIVGKKEENKVRNRFQNILAYDHTRVVLETPKEGASDYINATYIEGQGGTKKAYIATQGPKPKTIQEFWQMIWQEEVNKVVMLANFFENGRTQCAEYWPTDVGTSRSYDQVTVTTDVSDSYADYTYREFTVTKEGMNRTIHQFHYTSWPDKKQPDCVFALLAFVRRVKGVKDSGPLVVHCSAGVGRTGTYIALDYLLRQAEENGEVDIKSCVRLLRTQRQNMVQTFSQYKFIFEALIDNYKAGYTGFPSSSFSAELDQLRLTIPEEFKRLVSLKPVYDLEHCTGNLKMNQDKNRYPHILPRDEFRPYITPRVKASNDYINAVLTHSYQVKNDFIATTMPLPQTVSDFWRLVYDHDCKAIVMLNELDQSDQTCVAYWPEEEGSAVTHGPMRVTLKRVTEDKPRDLVIRDFEVKPIGKTHESSDSLIVRQFQSVGWPKELEKPERLSHILDVLDLLNKWKQGSSDGKTIVHCMDGATRCGIFCAASSLIEKLTTEQEVDVFLACRHVTDSRPEFIKDLNQYSLLHDLAKEYLAQYEQYANFNP